MLLAKGKRKLTITPVIANQAMNKWTPATVEAVRDIVERDLLRFDAAQREAFARYAVAPFAAPICRYGTLESVVVVARRGNEVIYWEDVEEGFNVSPIAPDSHVLEHWCNQDELGFALNQWIPGRTAPNKVAPANSVNE